jgi:hypothetical protein
MPALYPSRAESARCAEDFFSASADVLKASYMPNRVADEWLALSAGWPQDADIEKRLFRL